MLYPAEARRVYGLGLHTRSIYLSWSLVAEDTEALRSNLRPLPLATTQPDAA